MQQEEKLLQDYSDTEKGAYLTAIASIATADRQASQEELQFLDVLSDTAELPETQKAKVAAAANSLSPDELKSSLDTLKNSELRFSLLTDLIAFAESDQNYSAEEKTSIQNMATYLNINQEQFATINQFVQKTTDTNVAPEDVQKQGFLDSLGMKEKFQGAGLNMGSLTKGLLGMAGPMILANMVRKGLGGGNAGGGLGGMLGGLLGGNNRTAAPGSSSKQGGLGSLISMISGGRGIGSAGGMLGKIFKGGF